MNLNRNNRVLERLQAVYSAVFELSDQGLDVTSIEITSSGQPRVMVTRDCGHGNEQSLGMTGVGVRRGCEVILMARGH